MQPVGGNMYANLSDDDSDTFDHIDDRNQFTNSSVITKNIEKPATGTPR